MKVAVVAHAAKTLGEGLPDGMPSSASARPTAWPSGRGRWRALELDRKVRYELDGGDRSKVQAFKVKVEEGALRVRVPRRDPEER